MYKIKDFTLIQELEGWKTIKTMAEECGVTVQALYYRAKTGYYDVANFGGVAVIKPKTVSKLRRVVELSEGNVQ